MSFCVCVLLLTFCLCFPFAPGDFVEEAGDKWYEKTWFYIVCGAVGVVLLCCLCLLCWHAHGDNSGRGTKPPGAGASLLIFCRADVAKLDAIHASVVYLAGLIWLLFLRPRNVSRFFSLRVVASGLLFFRMLGRSCHAGSPFVRSLARCGGPSFCRV